MIDPFAWLNETERLLLELLNRNPAVPEPAATALLGPSDWDRLLALAKIMRISPLLYYRLREKGLSHHLPDACRSSLRQACLDTTLRNLRAYGALRRLARLLEREDIPVIVLKGMFLADAVYRDIGLREMNDIDLLARPQHVQRIAELAGELGYAPRVDVNQEDAEEIHLHLPRLIKEGEAGFEIHWNVTHSNRRYRIDPDELWKRALPVKLQGTNVLAFCPEDMLLHLCLHTSYHHQFAFGLRPSCDIAELLLWCGDRFDWDAVLERSERWGWGRGVYMALLLAKKLVDAPVPGGITARLKPADITADILNAAVSQVFTNSRIASTIPKPFADLILYERLGGKLGILLNRVFLPKRTMAVLYPACRGSWKIYVYYPRRLLDVLRRHGRTFRKIKQGDPELLHLAKRKQLIDGFLQKI
ncbi:nucleotidyltransferase domain-containing protein [Desulfatiglans anilini]|uniref:nucleotidyltransferase domain-containing protein n=1 Tax=Desulfatiglans anilini TaxID=90728 RepID=UPI00048658FA|nr:nucleotidyltransferase family protein [Desulfatiglans anilini]